MTNTNRADEFKAEIESLRLRGGSAGSERLYLIGGLVLLVAGVGLASLGAVRVVFAGASPADQRAFIASGSLLGLALIVAGAVLFLRYSLGRYLRFWMIRLTYEQRAAADRIVDAIERASGLDEPTTVLPGAAGVTVVRETPAAAPGTSGWGVSES